MIELAAFDGHSLLLDSNLSVLYCVGMIGARVSAHKRLGGYDETDLALLRGIIERTRSIHTSPNVLTETSNLARQVPAGLAKSISQAIARLIDITDEQYVASREAAQLSSFLRLGLTDSVLLLMLERNPASILLTADQELFLAGARGTGRAANFNHFRDQRPDFR